MPYCKTVQGPKLFGKLGTDTARAFGHHAHRGLQVLCVEVSPFGHPSHQSLLQGSSVHLNVADHHALGQCLQHHAGLARSRKAFPSFQSGKPHLFAALRRMSCARQPFEAVTAPCNHVVVLQRHSILRVAHDQSHMMVLCNRMPSRNAN